MNNDKLSASVGRAAKWSSITEISAKIITPLTTMILARLLAPEAFGIITAITMVTSFAGLFSDAGFPQYLVQHEFKNNEEKFKNANVAFLTNLTVALILLTIIIIFEDWIANISGNPGLGLVLAIASVQIPLNSFSSIQTALYRRDFDFRGLFIVRIVGVLIPFVITIPLAVLDFGYWALLIGSICGTLSSVIILTVKSKWKPSLYYSFAILKDMFSFSGWSLLQSIAVWFTMWVDAFIIGNAFNAYYLGLYKNSLNMVNALMAIVTASIMPVLFSALSRLQDNEAGFQSMYYRTQRFVSYLVFPMGVGVFLYRDLATYVMFGSQWNEAGNIVGALVLMASTEIIFSNFNGTAYLSKGRPRLLFLCQVIHLIFLIPTCIISSGFGFWALVYARALIPLQLVITGFIFMKVIMGFSVKEMLGNVAKPVSCTLLMGLVAVGLQQVSSSFIWDLISIIICVAVYAGLLLLIARSDTKDVYNILYKPLNRYTTEGNGKQLCEESQ